MAFAGPVDDRLAIHELVASHGDAVTRRSAEDWIANWADDAEWVKRDGRWLFKSRSLTVLHIGPG